MFIEELYLMMKNINYILPFLVLLSCGELQKKEVIAIDKLASEENLTLEMKQFKIDYNGTWALTNYFDTIVKKKELAKYRMQKPTWFAILLEIEGDSIKTFGSISNEKFFIEKGKDTLATISLNISGSKWSLVKKERKINLIQYDNKKRIDSTTYVFRKRDDFNYFTRENTDFFVIGKNVTEYFNQQLFKGKYFIKNAKGEVVFKADGSLIGIDKFDTYEVRNYFGTLHMHKNLDVITFKNKNDNEFKQYNWVFKNDQLILTEFVYEKITYNGKVYDGDYLVLGKDKIVLNKY